MSDQTNAHLEVYDGHDVVCSLEDDIGNTPQDVLESARRITKLARGILQLEKDGIVTDVYSLGNPLRIHYHVCDAKRYDQRRKKWGLASRFVVVTTDPNAGDSYESLEDAPEDWDYEDELNSILEWEPE